MWPAGVRVRQVGLLLVVVVVIMLLLLLLHWEHVAGSRRVLLLVMVLVLVPPPAKTCRMRAPVLKLDHAIASQRAPREVHDWMLEWGAGIHGGSTGPLRRGRERLFLRLATKISI